MLWCMTHTEQRLEKLGVAIPSVLLPRQDVDLYRWAVIACDQHTSEPDYWEEVESVVGDAPSTLNLVYPEVYLDEADRRARIQRIHETMQRYLEEGVLEQQPPGILLTVRGTPHVSERRGLILALDLEEYDYSPGASSLIRATEKTIVDRLPPRVEVRRQAPVELPHVLVLVNDPEDELIGSLDLTDLQPAYRTQLMLGGGHVAGYRLAEPQHQHVAAELERLLDNSSADPPFLFAVGDGNHSLATAKSVWDEMKETAVPDHPARYALVEVVNLYDPGLRFEPIHRLIRFAGGAQVDTTEWVRSFAAQLGGECMPASASDVRRAIDSEPNTIGYVTAGECGTIDVGSSRELPVARAQSALDRMSGFEIDFIHGWDTSVQLGSRSDSAAILLPEFDPHLLYPTVEKRGVLPRKSFSLGDAEEKRYYLEARRVL